jgi:ribosomal protein L16 Arg81 hydroxylase
MAASIVFLICVFQVSYLASSGGSAEASLQDETPYGFAKLCASSFADENWADKTLLVESAGADVGSIFDLADLVELLIASNGSVTVTGGTAKDGRTVSVSPQPQRKKGSIMDFFRNSTIAFSAIETQLPRLAAWSRTFARAFGITSEVNLYLTPPGAQAFSVHNDRQEVLAAQVHGQKTWKVWDLKGLELPDEIMLEPAIAPFRHTVSLITSGAASLDAFPPASLDVSLQPGALLYVPRGSLHVASTAGVSTQPSLHLTIGILTQSFSYAIAAFHMAAEGLLKDAIAQAGWDLHRFRQNIMKLADHKHEGAAPCYLLRS